MKIQELLEDRRTDEFVQALAPLAGAAARGLGAAAGAVGNAVKTGAQAVGQAATTGANAVGNGIKQVAQQTSNIKNTVSDLKGIMQQASGTGVDTNKLTQALATQAPGQQLDPATMKSLQGMIPALADALKNPTTAGAIKQALTTGVKADDQQQAQQAQQQTQQKPGAVGTVGSTSNTVAPT